MMNHLQTDTPHCQKETLLAPFLITFLIPGTSNFLKTICPLQIIDHHVIFLRASFTCPVQQIDYKYQKFRYPSNRELKKMALVVLNPGFLYYLASTMSSNRVTFLQ